MTDDEERIKAEKLAAAKKRVAQLQKQKKKASKKAASTDITKEVNESASSTPEPGLKDAGDALTSPVPVEEGKKEEDVAAAVEGGNAKDEAEIKSESPAPAPVEESTQAEAQPQQEEEEQQQQQQEQRDSSPTEPIPSAPTSPGPETEAQPAITTTKPERSATHGRQPSLSIQSKMRSSSFRKGSVSQGSASPAPSASLKSPSLPPLSADGEAVQEVYRKQSTRIEELERDNKRLERELEETTGRWKKTDEQLEDLREASVDIAELKERLSKAEGLGGVVEELKAEIASLQRQNSHLQTRTHRNTASVSVPAPSESPPADLVQQLESKSATIEAMELEISHLRAQLASSSAHETQIAALEEKLSGSESALEKTQRELSDTKGALTRASEKAVREGVDKTSTETLIKSLQRELDELKHEKAETDKKTDTLEKKLEAMGNLHKESETRHQTRLRESEKTEKEAAVLRKRLADVENDNLRLKEELEALRKRQSGDGGADDDAIDDLEDEERSRLHRRIRDLEGEVFDLRRGVWKERRDELDHHQTQQHQNYSHYSPENPATTSVSAANTFDDVDLIGGTPDHARRRSMAMANSNARSTQHSSFSTVLSSGIAAFTGGNSTSHSHSHNSTSGSVTRGRAASNQTHHVPAARGSLELLSEENFEDEFDEAEFARAQAEEEARKRVQWVREIKTKLRDWNGWRLDLVDSRAGAEGAGVGMGEIFGV
ncbi:hypothetical protein BO70DRAFT_364192 [Aspergillus heteromorphus CBS 117.55]|uniref:M protein repeat protein n=1 Tax=Aspergillus heteromorphus CBS 117.55 TaxID=1448321 RepID=A0A317VPC8_9EURO|nr:uncharacterized protein BO70DRAFT_364192 [Aspergillus heteromorphus CBS 117.55]PWY75121.1 hypothetical protein BO70DRAFT_364192 [Aspergillus heteromorphus CBS 117.55]